MPVTFRGEVTASPSTVSVGDTVTITKEGGGFIGTMVVKLTDDSGASFDNIAINAAYGNGQQQVTADVPAATAAGSYDIYVRNGDGQEWTVSAAVTVAEDAVAVGGLIIGPCVACI